MQAKIKKGFTLIEILLVITLLAILMGIVVLAINPRNLISEVNDNKREADAMTIYQALEQYALKNSAYPSAIVNIPNNSSAYICKTTSTNCTNAFQVNISTNILVPTYMSKIPEYSTDTNNTGFYVVKDSNGKIGVGGVKQVNNTTFVKGLESQSFATVPTSPIVTNGLVLHLDAGNPASYPGTGTTWTDLSGNGNNGALINGVGFNSANGGSLIFDGVNDRVSLVAGSDFSYGTGDFTLESWVYPTSFASLGKAIFTQTVSGTNYFLFGIGGAGEIVLVMTLSGGGSPIFGPSNIILNKWSHIAVTRISGVVTVYVNASPGIPIVNSIDLSNTTFVPTIGEYTHSNQLPFSGNISNLRIYKNKGLTSSEIQQNFNALRGRFGL